jgi:hypothetical protein
MIAKPVKRKRILGLAFVQVEQVHHLQDRAQDRAAARRGRTEDREAAGETNCYRIIPMNPKNVTF